LKWNVIIHTHIASLSGVHSFVTRREPLAHAVDAKLNRIKRVYVLTY